MKNKRTVLVLMLVAALTAPAAHASLWAIVGCSNSRISMKAVLQEHPEAAGLTWSRIAAGGGGTIDQWWLSIQGEAARKDYAGNYAEVQAREGAPTDVIVQACIKQSPIPPDPTPDQVEAHLGIVDWLREVTPGVRIHFLPLPHYETNCRGGAEQWPVDLVGLNLAEMHAGPTDFVMPPLPTMTYDDTRVDGCHQNDERASEDGAFLAAYMLQAED